MTNKLLRLPEVKKRTAKSKSTIYKDIAEGTFASPVKIGPRASAWVESEVQGWIDARISESREVA